MADLQPQLDLIQWVKHEDGFLHPSVEVASDPGGRGFHIRVSAGQTIRPNTRIASCPISATMSILNAMNVAPFSSRGVNFPSSFINNQSFTVVQYFFLMEQYLLGQKSWWAPYISAIPTPDAIGSMGFADDSEDMRWLAGTNLRGALAKQNEKWKELFTTASAHLKGLRWPNAECYTWRLFLWAATIFGSRGFTSQVLSDTLPADQARPAGHNHPRHEDLSKLFSDVFPVLCPLLDVLNYRPGARVEWQPRFSYVGLQVLEQYESGQEICNNYGPRDNENLMLGYYFAIPSNPFDHFAVGLRVPAGSPLAQTRTWYPDKKKDTDFQTYIFNLEHPRAKSASCLEASVFSFDLLDSISVLCANDRELQAMFESNRTYISQRLASKTKGDNRNLLNVFTQLYRECQQRLALLQRSDPKSNGETSRTPQQQYAQIYRQSQMEILTTATALCRYTLFRAQTKKPSEEVLQLVMAASTQLALDQTATSNLQQLVDRHTPLTQSHELFAFAELSQLLPAENLNNILTFLATTQSRTPNTQRASLAVLLAVLRNRTTRLPLPARFQTWFGQLDSWYDSSWSTLSAELDGSGSSDTSSVLTLLAQLVEWVGRHTRGQVLLSDNSPLRKSSVKGVDLEGLIWAWNVVGEESVHLPSGLLPAQDGQGQGDGEDAGSLMLYIPQRV